MSDTQETFIQMPSQESIIQPNPRDDAAGGGVFDGIRHAANYLLGASEKQGDFQGDMMTLNTPHVMSALSSKERTYLSNKLRIQGAIHGLCLYIKGVESVLGVPLPNPITLTTSGGFMISHNELGGDGQRYPLFLLRPESPVSEISLPLKRTQEIALVLLNRDIEYLNMLAGESQIIGASRTEGVQNQDNGMAASGLLMSQYGLDPWQ